MKILGTGYYIPKRKVDASEIDILTNSKEGTTLTKTGIKNRYYSDYNGGETASEMGKLAALEAIKNANNETPFKKEDIDLIIGANATREILLPNTSSFIQKKLGLSDSKIPCIDVDTTCLSFFTALDIANLYLKSNRYKNILIVSSEIGSLGINHNHLESSALFGDGAAAFLVTNDDRNILSKFETFSEGHDFIQVRGGGTRIPFKDYTEENHNDFLFDMNGRKSFRLIKKLILPFFNEFLSENNIDMNDIKAIVPHQASASGLKLVAKHLNLDTDKMIRLIEDYGNMIAASIPFGFSYGVKNGLIKRGDKVLLLGTSAGISIGMMVIEY